MEYLHVLITGASRGLGLNLTKYYLEEGATVFAGARQNNLQGLMELQESYPGKLYLLEIEVNDYDTIAKSVELVSGITKRIDILINNAAIHSKTSFMDLEDTNLEESLFVYDVNSVGPLRMVKAYVSFLRNSNFGKIINISSESGSISTCGREKEFDYCMSKAALNMATKLLANYLSKDNIYVGSIHPGWMRTDMGGMNAHLDPYETAVQIGNVLKNIKGVNYPNFIDNKGTEYPW